MAESSYRAPGETHLTAFVTAEYFLLGSGETIADLQQSGAWLATDDPAAVRR
jgi:hypothetical protein